MLHEGDNDNDLIKTVKVQFDNKYEWSLLVYKTV
jgi:hypothetical protein